MNSSLISIGKVTLFFLIAISVSPLVRQANRWNDCVDLVAEAKDSFDGIGTARTNALGVVACNDGMGTED